MNTLAPQIGRFTPQQIASICDHTFLNRVDAYRKDALKGQSPVVLREEAIRKFFDELQDLQFLPYAVCIHPQDVPFARDFLNNHLLQRIKIAAVVGFPDGSWVSTKYKLLETEFALDEGASEIDMVLNVQALKRDQERLAQHDVEEVAKLVHQKRGKLKLILETSELSPLQLEQACALAKYAGADFVKTSTGFSAVGASEEALKIMQKNFNGGIKISGGVTLENVAPLLEAAVGSETQLDPAKIRIGESSLLKSLEPAKEPPPETSAPDVSQGYS